jgi:SEC-C motif domain protein
MRSRYTAFVVGNIDHIAATNAQAGPDPFDRAHAESIVAEVEWRGLQIVAVSAGGAEDETGRLEFKARFSRLGQELVHHEAARFVKEQGRWAYLDGEINPKGTPRRVVSVGRNDPCPCGSGKRFCQRSGQAAGRRVIGYQELYQAAEIRSRNAATQRT